MGSACVLLFPADFFILSSVLFRLTQAQNVLSAVASRAHVNVNPCFLKFSEINLI